MQHDPSCTSPWAERSGPCSCNGSSSGDLGKALILQLCSSILELLIKINPFWSSRQLSIFCSSLTLSWPRYFCYISAAVPSKHQQTCHGQPPAAHVFDSPRILLDTQTTQVGSIWAGGFLKLQGYEVSGWVKPMVPHLGKCMSIHQIPLARLIFTRFFLLGFEQHPINQNPHSTNWWYGNGSKWTSK